MSRSLSARSCWSPVIAAVAWALASIANVLLVILVSLFSVAVLSPVVTAMERRFGWSRGLCSTVLVLAIVLVIGVVGLVLVQAISGSVRGFSDDLPQIVDKARHSDLGNFINRGSDSLETLEEARERHRQRGGKGVGRRRPRRSLGFRSGRARLLRRLPDALRADRRTAVAGLDRKPPVSGQPQAVPASHGSDHPHDLALHARQLGDLCDLRDGLWRHCVGARPPVSARRGGHRGDSRPHPERRRDDRRHHHRDSSRSRSASKR